MKLIGYILGNCLKM